ncbi:E3 ubiquitin-protein ligase RMND5A-like [Ptychodera flava]|uniref:E3 ubiquitin-protein ligase RMND5A-like n=1 Tax=Ptychodera flava TaxID=63121 RepID=UPI003969D1A1
MDACLTVERDVDKVYTKFQQIASHTQKTLEELIQHVKGISNELKEAPEDSELTPAQSLVVSQCTKKMKDSASYIGSNHKDLHSSVSKIGKVIDRNFMPDINALGQESNFDSPEKVNLINEVICEHFFRKGMLDIAEQLIDDAALQVDGTNKEPFIEINKILEALKARNLQPALQWAQIHREQLHAQHSSLEFKLHRLQFIELLRGGAANQQQILQYARNFGMFADGHSKELQIMMGSLLYLRQGIQNSPYSHLLDPINWLEICDVFTRDACSLLGLSVESPLCVSVQAGAIALPSLLNIKHVMQQRQVSGVWSSKDELPIEVDLGTDCRYHSIFACPILRQQSTDHNPPMRLICGHVISRDSLNKLISGNKVKCPYCPVEQSPSDARQIHF